MIIRYGWVDARACRTYRELEEAYQALCAGVPGTPPTFLVPEFVVVDDGYYHTILEQFYPPDTRGIVKETSLGFAVPYNDAGLMRWTDFVGRLQTKQEKSA